MALINVLWGAIRSFSSSVVFTETLLWNFCLGTTWSNWPLWDPSCCILLLDKNSSVCFSDLGIMIIQHVLGNLRKNSLKIMQRAVLQVLWAFSFTFRESKSFRDWVGGVSFLTPKLVSLWEDLKHQNRDYKASLNLLESCMSNYGPIGILEISYLSSLPLDPFLPCLFKFFLFLVMS